MDTSVISTTLRSGTFKGFIEISKAIELATDKLATWSEVCPCHAKLFKRLSRWKKKKLVSNHYQDLWGSCLVSGCWAAHLAAGKLDSILVEIWTETEDAYYTALGRTGYMTPDDMSFFQTAFQQATSQ